MYCAACKNGLERKRCVQQEDGNKIFCSISCRNFYKRGCKPTRNFPTNDGPIPIAAPSSTPIKEPKRKGRKPGPKRAENKDDGYCEGTGPS